MAYFLRASKQMATVRQVDSTRAGPGTFRELK